MKAINKIVLIAFQIIFSLTIYAQESVQVNNKIYSDSDCPVGAPSNPFPSDGTENVELCGTTLFWTNGTGTTKNEIWFGKQGNLVKIYDGPAIAFQEISALQYLTKYYWFVICKNDSCGTAGPIWQFTTEIPPYDLWSEDFNNLNNWIIVGPQGLTNWTVNNSAAAGGTPPELRLSWTPTFNGETKIRSKPFLLNAFQCCLLEFSFFFDWFADPSGTVSVGITYDGGLTSTQLYSITNPTANFGPTTILVYFGSQSTFNQCVQFEISYSGNSFNYNYIYWDNLYFNYLLTNQCFPGPPGSLTAQVIFDPHQRVKLDWQDNTWNEEGFKVFRKNGGLNDPGDYALVGTVGQNQTQYIDTTVMPQSIYTYYVISFNGYGQNESNKVTINVPIPVELISFTAEVEESIVKLFWQTATETNNSGFEIQRLQDYKNKKLSEWISSEQDWEVIGFVAGKGTTTEVQNYSFTDNLSHTHTLNQVIRYRLKQIDYDGSFKFSSEIEIGIQAPNIFSLEQNYPNPFNPTTKIKYSIPTVTLRQAQSDNWVTLKVYDVLGNEITTLVNERKPEGNYEVEFNGNDLPSGVYFYQLKAGPFIQTKKMVLLR